MNNHYDNVVDEFISFCDKLSISEEGFFFSKIFGKEESSKVKNNPPASSTVPYKYIKASGSDLEMLYSKEAYCAEGMTEAPMENKNAPFWIDVILNKWKCNPKEIKEVGFYWCYGKDINQHYHLTGDNIYPDKLAFFFIDWQTLGKSFKAGQHKGKFRYFSDVVDNNARREIFRKNPYYKNYKSIYGDDWLDNQLKAIQKAM